MMMMIGDPPRSNPTVQIPQHDYAYYEDPTAHIHSPISYENAYTALQRYLPSNNTNETDDLDFIDDFDVPVDAFSCDNFRMFDFKVKKCARARSHDWTECPFAHPGEKARRRDPRKHHYSGAACPDFRKGACKRGDTCEYAHGVFECWLHPARYRTQPCKDGTHCRRRVCFFAHTPDQLRVLPGSPDGSPTRPGFDPVMMYGYSPPSSPPTTGSPPISPDGGSFRLCQLAESMRAMQISKVKMGLGMGLGLSVSPPSWKMGFGSPRSPVAGRPGFMSLPATPVRAVKRTGIAWEPAFEEEPAMERVESGRELRERIYAKIGKENALDRVGRVDPDPDVGWVSELVN